mgnify:CR=1 FL=1
MSNPRISARLTRNMMSSLVMSGKIKTTKKKAGDIKEAFQKFTSRVKKIEGETERYRFAKKYLFGGAPKKLIDEIETYSKIKTYSLSERKGDGALEVIVKIEKISESKKKVKNG